MDNNQSDKTQSKTSQIPKEPINTNETNPESQLNTKSISNNSPKKSSEENIQNENKTKDQTKEKVEEKKVEEKKIDDIEENSQQSNINEKEQKIKSEIREVVQEKSNRIFNFGNKLDNILNSIDSMWQNCRQSYANYYETNIKPEILALLSQPCITIIQENVVLIFKFLCQYYSMRMKYLKEIPQNEIYQMYMILFGNLNLVNRIPAIENSPPQNSDLIDDRVFYQVFKELLPEKEIENSYIIIYGNCLLKYLVEFLFQIGFAEAFIENVLTRNDLDPIIYLQISLYPCYFFVGCEKDFILKHNYNIRIIKYVNEKVDYYLNSELMKNTQQLNNFCQYFMNTTNDRIFSTFNRIYDTLLEKYPQDCEKYCLNALLFCEYYLKMQKLDMRIAGIVMLGNLIEAYRVFNIQLFRYKYNDIEPIFDYSKKVFVKYLMKINIFDIIFGENIHEALIQRSFIILSFLYKNKAFTPKEIALLWELSQTKYQSISNSIITLIGQLLPEFSNEDCNSILDIVSKMNFNEVNEITLKLLENFFIGNERREILLNILFKLSNEASYNQGLSKSIIIKSRQILVRLLFNRNYIDDLLKYISLCISNLQHFCMYNTYNSTFIQILEEFERNSNPYFKDLYSKIDNNVQDFKSLINFLEQKYSLFDIYINLLSKVMTLFKFFYDKSLEIKSFINNGNFDYETLLNVDLLYKDYVKYTNKGKENVSQNNNNMDIDEDENNINNSNKINNKSENEQYIKSLIHNYVEYFKEKFLKTNTLLSDTQIKVNIFFDLPLTFEGFNYNIFVHNITDFIFYTHLKANIHCKREYLDKLFILEVQKNINFADFELFYNILFRFFSSQINQNNNNINYHLLSDSDMEYFIKEKICKDDYRRLPLPAFLSVNLYSIYFNQKNGYANYSIYTQKYTKINNFENLYGFEIIWNFYIYTENNQIYQQSLNVLINILELTSQDMNNHNQIINKIFTYIKNNKTNIQKNIIIKTGFIRCLKLISVVNGTKFNKDISDFNNNSNNVLDLNIKNAFFTVQENNTTPIKFPKLKKIKELKEYIIDKILCTEYYLNIYNNSLSKSANTGLIDEDTIPEVPIKSLDEFKSKILSNNIIINYKNKILQNEYTLADYNVDSGAILTIIRCEGSYSSDNYVPSESVLKEGYESLRLVFQDKFNEEIMKASIIKSKGDIEGAIMFLTDNNNVANLEKEIEESKRKVTQVVDNIICLEEEKINTLLDIMENGDDEIICNIWQLFSEIKYPYNIINKSVGDDFAQVLNEKNIYRLIFSLKLINSLVFDDDFCKYNKILKEQKNSWISKFINSGFIGNILSILANFTDKNITQNQMLQLYNIFINWFYEIIYKISDLFKDENENINKIITNIKNSKNNNINNNANSNGSNNNANVNSNDNDDNKQLKEKETNKFEIINKEEAVNFLNSLDQCNAGSLFYNIIFIAVTINNNDRTKIIQNIYEIILIYLTLRPLNLSKFSLEEKNKKNLFNMFTSENFEPQIRKLTANFIKILIKDDTNSNNELFILLYSSFNNAILSEKIYDEQFYELYGFLLATSNKINKDLLSEPPVESLMENVYNLSYNLEPSNINDSHRIMFDIYILSCCHPFHDELLKKSIDKMKNENKDILNILYNCLFDISRYKNKCNCFKYIDIFLRKHSFILLNIFLSLDKKYLLSLLPKILSNHSKLSQVESETPLDVNMRNVSNEKLIGLRNFGATCYLNSLFQQMFMIPTFRRDIFNFNIKAQDENLNKIYLKTSVIYNMQLTFANLLMGCMSPYPPSRFIKSFKNAFNGEPIHFGVQQDSDEFLAILCENLEKESKIYKNENFLENSFKGKLANEIVSLESEYPYYSQSEEPFYRVTLDIKGHKTLEEALDAYVKGEVLDGDNKYFVDKYKKKISIRKSISLKKLANQIIIHLKRFEFDFVTFTNNKLNDYLKFPLEINFKKWTRAYLRTSDLNINKDLLNITKEEEENLIDEKMNYILTGILVHGGSNLQSGHYYSFIMDQETGNWYQFNDNTITPYNIDKDLEKECFGNLPEQADQYGRGAYLLFYTKKECFRNPKILKDIHINDDIVNEVIRENVNFLNIHNYTNVNYQIFLKTFIENSIKVLDDDVGLNQTTLNKNLEINEEIYYKVLKIIKGDKDDIDSEDDLDNENNKFPENIVEIYEKCKIEVEKKNLLENDNDDININTSAKNYTKKDIIKYLFFYTFGIGYNYFQNNNNLFCSLIHFFNDVLKENIGYSLWVLKQIENNYNLFTDLIFKYGTFNKELYNTEQEIFNMFKICFDCIYEYEKSNNDILRDEIKYFIKTSDNKIITMKENKSIIMRILRHLFCDNLEKSRVNYMNNNEYLELFYYLVKNYHESSLICVNYLPTLISLFSNNTIEGFKSFSNPNFIMGGSSSFAVHNYYIMIFSEIVLHCVTPGMLNSRKYSPFFLGKNTEEDNDEEHPRFNLYPQLPQNWENIIRVDLFINYILCHNYSKSKEIICHLCFCDEKISIKILTLVNNYIREKYMPLPFVEKVLNESFTVFNLKDSLEFIRLNTLFQLDDINKEREPCDNDILSLFEFFYENKKERTIIILLVLYCLANAFKEYEIIFEYFNKNKNKISWIKDIINDLNSNTEAFEKFKLEGSFILSLHKDLFQVIKDGFVNKLNFDKK